MSEIESSITLSVVITCYCEGELLHEAVNSALTQPVQEIVIVNDASFHDLTNQVCRELESYENITVVWRRKNGGPSVARNDGFKKAQGDILVPLDADDLLPQNTLRHLAEAFEKNSEIGFVYGPYWRQDKENEAAKIIFPTDITLQDMLRAKPFSFSSRWQLLGTTPIRKSLWQQLGGYDESFGAQDLHDVEFWIRAIASGCKYVTIKEPIYIWRKYLGNNSRKVTPLSWYKIAKKYFETYQAFGLEYRAYELLLIGSKWLEDPESTAFFRSKLIQCRKTGKYHFSSFLALVTPAPLLKLVSKGVEYYR